MRRPSLLPQPTGSSGYVDAIGRKWDVEILDRLLGTPAVLRIIQSLYINALCDTGGRQDFSPGVVWAWLKGEYRRDEVVALYLLLVARYRDIHIATPGATSAGGQP